MRNLFKTPKLILLAVIVFLTAHTTAQMKPTTSGYAPVNGIKVYYEVYGEGTPLILLHGAFYTIGMNWSELLPSLAKTHKVIALEMQGHGHSPYSDRKLSITGLASDVTAVMDYLKIDSADIAGYSMGGSIAYQFAVSYPKRLKKLVIISSTYKTSGWITAVSGAFKNFKPEFFDNTPIKTGYEAVAPDKTKWKQWVEQMIVFAGEPFDVGDANIAKLTAPVLIICGDNDGVDKVELAKTYQLLGGGVAGDLGVMPKSQLAIIPSQTHVGVMMQTAAISAYMTNFLK